jgi:hypothetical protein
MKTACPSETTCKTAMLVTTTRPYSCCLALHLCHPHFKLWMLCTHFQLFVGTKLACKITLVSHAEHVPRIVHPSLRVSRIYTEIHKAGVQKLQAGFVNTNQPFDHFHIVLCVLFALSNMKRGKARHGGGGG